MAKKSPANSADHKAVIGDAGPALVFDLDGTIVDSVYQHVLAWREALEAAGITPRSGGSTGGWA